MAKKDKPEESREGIITTAAKKVGKAAGKIASAVGGSPEAPLPARQPSKKVPKLEKKNKNRLPRREKKARQKAASLSPGGQHS